MARSTFQQRFRPIGFGSKRLPQALTTVAVTSVLVVALSACGSSEDKEVGDVGPSGDAAWQTVIEAAKEEGQVNIYSGNIPDSLKCLASSFKTTYGITVNVTNGINAVNQTKVDTELQTGNVTVDVIDQTEASWSVPKAQAGDFAAPTGPAFDAPAFDAAENLKEGGWFISNASMTTFVWNTDLYSKGLKDYDGVLDPELAGGKIGVIEPSAPVLVEFYLYLEERFGPGFIEKLAAQNPRLYPSAFPLTQAVTSGEIAASIFSVPVVNEKAQGAPVDFALSQPIFGTRFNTAVLAKAPHPNAAQLLANFMITPAGQECISNRAASILPNIPGTLATEDEVIDPAADGELTPEEVQAFKDKFNRLFT
jgi:iron(III) transport system substrate-binding protein